MSTFNPVVVNPSFEADWEDERFSPFSISICWWEYIAPFSALLWSHELNIYYNLKCIDAGPQKLKLGAVNKEEETDHQRSLLWILNVVVMAIEWKYIYDFLNFAIVVPTMFLA